MALVGAEKVKIKAIAAKNIAPLLANRGYND